MQPLDRTLRRQLENTIKEAREEAEAGARAAIEQLGVGAKAAFPHLSDQEKELRRKLRIHGKQLGDQRDSKSTNPTVGEQETINLVEEVAYEHWHRMLFARFLAENNLLMYPDEHDPVPVTLEECEDLAADEGAANGWELAARYASRMLPQIFRPDSPVFQLTLPPERQHRLERLLAGLPQEVFHASDALGWVYQFWQAKRKDEVNASEVKIGARELPAVTQLFTEPYMVSFLLDNTLGAWWAGKRLSEDDLANATSEEELRRKASLPGVPLEYLRFVQDEGGAWRPAAGTYEGWPDEFSDLKVLDPCCGSGHFLVAAFHMLVPMRMEAEGLSEQEATDAVLRENLHGLEIDKRCTEIAAFALAQAAWIRTGYRALPELQIACTGLAPRASAEEWIELAEKSGVPMSAVEREPVKRGLRHMHELFSQSPTLGSLIDPTELPSEGFAADFETIKPYLTAVLDREDADDEAKERAIAAAGMVKAADLLASDYNVIVTNVPYLGRNKQNQCLMNHLEQRFNAARWNLAAACIVRFISVLDTHGTIAVVAPQDWLLGNRYESLRRHLLPRETWRVLTFLGPGSFETISGEVVTTALAVIDRKPFDADSVNPLLGLNVQGYDSPHAKSTALKLVDLAETSQAQWLNNPGLQITVESVAAAAYVGDYGRSWQGIKTSDDPRFVMRFWELQQIGDGWHHYLRALGASPFSGREHVLFWEDGYGVMTEVCQKGAPFRGVSAWGKRGVVLNTTGIIRAGVYLGEKFASEVTAITAEEDNLPALLQYTSSPEFSEALRRLDKRVSVTTTTFNKVPFDADQWRERSNCKAPWEHPESNDPTQWLFHGRPEVSTDPLQVAVARLLGYRWPAELDPDMRLSERARELVKRCDELLLLADKDGIVCIPPVRGEPSAADRLHNLLAKAYGDAWSTDKLNELLNQADHAGKTLESWLRDKFFTQHCHLFGQCPFVWHIWDGLKDGFAALVNYHKLDHKNLQTLIYTYLGDWISRQRRDLDNGVDGAEEKLAAAEALKKRLELILHGEAPYDIFVRWKPLEEQPMGWQPDLNDGVRVNIRPFISVPDVKKRGAGVLRDKPKSISWGKDRGKEPHREKEQYPWFWGWDEKTTDFMGGKKFDGNRWNDCHYTLETKQAAREAVQEAV